MLLAITIFTTCCWVDSTYLPGQEIAGEPDCDALGLITSRQDLSETCFDADLNLATLNGSMHIKTRDGSRHLPLLLAAYNAHDAASRSGYAAPHQWFQKPNTSDDWLNALQIYVEGPKLSTELHQQHS